MPHGGVTILTSAALLGSLMLSLCPSGVAAWCFAELCLKSPLEWDILTFWFLGALRCKIATLSLMVERSFLRIKRGDAPPLLLTDVVCTRMYTLTIYSFEKGHELYGAWTREKKSVLPTEASAGCRFIPEELESLLFLQFSTILKVGWKNCPLASFSLLRSSLLLWPPGLSFCVAGLCPVQSVFWRRVLWAGVPQPCLWIFGDLWCSNVV